MRILSEPPREIKTSRSIVRHGEVTEQEATITIKRKAEEFPIADRGCDEAGSGGHLLLVSRTRFAPRKAHGNLVHIARNSHDVVGTRGACLTDRVTSRDGCAEAKRTGNEVDGPRPILTLLCEDEAIAGEFGIGIEEASEELEARPPASSNYSI